MQDNAVLTPRRSFEPPDGYADGAPGNDAATTVELVASMGDIGALRGVTEASADLADCTCPEPCERDHANE